MINSLKVLYTSLVAYPGRWIITGGLDFCIRVKMNWPRKGPITDSCITVQSEIHSK